MVLRHSAEKRLPTKYKIPMVCFGLLHQARGALRSACRQITFCYGFYGNALSGQSLQGLSRLLDII